jgi:hypothetical protein
VITKHEGTGGLVSIGTVTAQLLYEIDKPAYANPDVVARFDTIRLEQEGQDRVKISGVKGEPAPKDVKVCLNYLGGFRNQMTFVLTGLDIEEKAALIERGLRRELDVSQFDSFEVELARTDRPDARTNQEAAALLKVSVKSQDAKKVGRAFSGPIIEMVLANYPGFFTTTLPGDGNAFGVYWPTLVPADVPKHAVVLEDGSRIAIPPSEPGPAVRVEAAAVKLPGVPGGPTKLVPLGTLFGARSGDKGGNANVGVWAKDDASYAWLAAYLTADRFRELIPEAAKLEVRRYELANLKSLNFLVVGLLGEGVASSTRFDPQAKSLGEYLRSRRVEMPEALLNAAR